MKVQRIPLPEGNHNLTRGQKSEYNKLINAAVKALGEYPTQQEIDAAKLSTLQQVIGSSKVEDVAAKTLPPPPAQTGAVAPMAAVVLEEAVKAAKHVPILQAFTAIFEAVSLPEVDAENKPNGAHQLLREVQGLLGYLTAELLAAFSLKCSQDVLGKISGNEAEKGHLVPTSKLPETETIKEVNATLAKLEEILALTPQTITADQKAKLERLTTTTSSMKDGDNAAATEALRVSLGNIEVRNQNYYVAQLMKLLLTQCKDKLEHRLTEVKSVLETKPSERVLRRNDHSEQIGKLVALMKEAAATKELLDDLNKVVKDLGLNNAQHGDFTKAILEAFDAQVTWLEAQQKELAAAAAEAKKVLEGVIKEEEADAIDPDAAACLEKKDALEEAHNARQHRIEIAKTQISTIDALLAHIENRIHYESRFYSNGAKPLLEKLKAQLA